MHEECEFQFFRVSVSGVVLMPHLAGSVIGVNSLPPSQSAKRKADCFNCIEQWILFASKELD